MLAVAVAANGNLVLSVSGLKHTPLGDDDVFVLLIRYGATETQGEVRKHYFMGSPCVL